MLLRKRIGRAVLLALCAGSAGPGAAQRPDLSGTWQRTDPTPAAIGWPRARTGAADSNPYFAWYCMVHMARMVKKTLELDQDYVDRAREFFRVKTEKQAVNKALELVAIDDEIISAHRAAGGKGGLIEEVFE